MYRKILVPVDGSKRAEAILTHVENLSNVREIQVVLLKVEEQSLILERDEVIDTVTFGEELETRTKQACAYLDSLQARLLEKGIRSETRLACGGVVKAILSTAAEMDADLIAIASHGIGASPRVSFGSVAAGVLQAADIPILLIRSFGET